MITATLRNDFHNTEVRVRVPETLEAGELHPISASTARRIRRALCGMRDCECGVVRGRQHYMLVRLPNNRWAIGRTYEGAC